MIAFGPNPIALAGTTQRLLDVAAAVNRVRRTPGEGHVSRYRTFGHLHRQRRLCRILGNAPALDLEDPLHSQPAGGRG